jgi:hypothetical protein
MDILLELRWFGLAEPSRKRGTGIWPGAIGFTWWSLP